MLTLIYPKVALISNAETLLLGRGYILRNISALWYDSAVGSSPLLGDVFYFVEIPAFLLTYFPLMTERVLSIILLE